MIPRLLQRHIGAGNEPDPAEYELLSRSSPTSDNSSEVFLEKAVHEPARRSRACFVLGVLRQMLPRFLHGDYSATSKHPTAWLGSRYPSHSTTPWLTEADGLRGVAALFVAIHHSTLVWFSWDIHNAWIPGQTNHPFQFYFIRLVVSGAPQVAIFFVVSGFSLSYKPLKLIHSGQGGLAEALGSSIARRYPRLFLPVVAVTFLTAVLSLTGVFQGEGLEGTAQPIRQPPQAESLWGQLADWAYTVPYITDPLSKEMLRGASNYDPNLWTLPVEFDNSLVVFLVLAAFSRMRTTSRLTATLILASYVQYRVHWAMFLFVSGMFLCDLHFTLEKISSALPSSHSTAGRINIWLSRKMGTSSKPTKTRSALAITVFIAALHLLAMPERHCGALDSPGYQTLASLVPAQFLAIKGDGDFLNGADYLWVPIGAVLMVLAVDQARFLQAIFTTSVAQYLGRISFSLYLVHGTLLWSLGRSLGVVLMQATGATTDREYCLAILLTAVLWWPVAIWVADIVDRLVDSPSVRVGKWVYSKLLPVKTAEEMM